MNLRKAVFLLALAATLFGAFSVTATAKAPKKTAIFNLTETPQVKPARYFLTADAGPYVRQIKWSGWGKGKAVGRGRFISDCASCGEKENKPAKLVLWKKVYCPDFHVYSYKFGRLRVIDPTRNRVTPIAVSCPSRDTAG
ncbi:MAG: hypothetical protein J0H98_08565 [Solirubrobacterales bacterium]|nr:hypothetical protein [Solirubrobacterales bacterium]